MIAGRDLRWAALGGAVAALCACSHFKNQKPASRPEDIPPASAILNPPAARKEPYAILITSTGTITIRLLPDAAPKAVDNFIALSTGAKEWTDPATGQKTKRLLYKGSTFFRAIPGYIIQGGSPTNMLFGQPGYEFEDEFSKDHLFTRPGLLAYANSGPDTNGSQFFITLIPAPWLNYKHTVFGEVTEGLAVVQNISRMPRKPDGDGDSPMAPVVLNEIRIEYR